jgi:hypothetical protein
MAHRSRLTTVLVDVPAADHAAAVGFWSAALGRSGQPVTKYPEYHYLGEVTPGIEFMVQATGDATPRVHVDLETDDVAAEVARLERLGATVVDVRESWTVMRDPVGLVFCVVRVQVPAMFDQHATTWD